MKALILGLLTYCVAGLPVSVRISELKDAFKMGINDAEKQNNLEVFMDSREVLTERNL